MEKHRPAYKDDRRKIYKEVFKPSILSNNPNIIEIGVWRGANLERFRNILEPTRLIGVDPYVRMTDQPNITGDKEQSYLDEIYKKVVNAYADDPTVEILRETSAEASTRFDDHTFDLVYIDGDHTYEGCLDDIKRWWPKLKYGGILAGHDFCKGNQFDNELYGVIPAVEQFFIHDIPAESRRRHIYRVHNEWFPTWWVYK